MLFGGQDFEKTQEAWDAFLGHGVCSEVFE